MEKKVDEKLHHSGLALIPASTVQAMLLLLQDGKKKKLCISAQRVHFDSTVHIDTQHYAS